MIQSSLHQACEGRLSSYIISLLPDFYRSHRDVVFGTLNSVWWIRSDLPKLFCNSSAWHFFILLRLVFSLLSMIQVFLHLGGLVFDFDILLICFCGPVVGKLHVEKWRKKRLLQFISWFCGDWINSIDIIEFGSQV